MGEQADSEKKVDTRLAATMSGLAVLVIVAAIQKSAVMFVSIVAIAAIVYILRQARMRDRIIAVFAAALSGSIGAEIIHTFYRHMGSGDIADDSGGVFMSAMLIGITNAVVTVAVIVGVEAWQRHAPGKPR